MAFSDGGEYDDHPHQMRLAQLLDTEHHTIEFQPADIARVFPDVAWHAETRLVRTASDPLYLLNSLVRNHGFKVVLTGEGSDEFLLGYDIFWRSTRACFLAQDLASKLGTLLRRKLIEHIPEFDKASQFCLESFFGSGLARADSAGFSH